MKTVGQALLLSMCVLLCVMGHAACGNERNALVVETIQLRHLRPEAAMRIIEPYVFADRGGTVSFEPESGLITIRESRDMIGRIQEVLARYDTPEPSVKLSFRLIKAGPNGNGVDSRLQDIVDDLPTSVLRFDSYELLSEASISGIEWSTVYQVLSGQFRVESNIREVREDADGGTIQLEVALIAEQPVFQTAVNARLGQLLVLGTASSPDQEYALILTLKPELERP